MNRADPPVVKRLYRLIALTGFMGCGKSTVARLLARQIAWHYADLDRHITEHAHMTIPEIFAHRGEAGFREVEHQELRRILGEAAAFDKPMIISLGGGTTSQPRNLALLREAACPIVYLHCPVEELLRRCSRITNRPLFRDEASFRKLHAERLPSYELADFRVNSSIEPLGVVQQILNLGILEGVPV